MNWQATGSRVSWLLNEVKSCQRRITLNTVIWTETFHLIYPIWQQQSWQLNHDHYACAELQLNLTWSGCFLPFSFVMPSLQDAQTRTTIFGRKMKVVAHDLGFWDFKTLCRSKSTFWREAWIKLPKLNEMEGRVLGVPWAWTPGSTTEDISRANQNFGVVSALTENDHLTKGKLLNSPLGLCAFVRRRRVGGVFSCCLFWTTEPCFEREKEPDSFEREREREREREKERKVKTGKQIRSKHEVNTKPTPKAESATKGKEWEMRVPVQSEKNFQ